MRTSSGWSDENRAKPLSIFRLKMRRYGVEGAHARKGLGIHRGMIYLGGQRIAQRDKLQLIGIIQLRSNR